MAAAAALALALLLCTASAGPDRKETARKTRNKLLPNHEADTKEQDTKEQDCSKIKVDKSRASERCAQCNQVTWCEYCLTSGTCVKRSESSCPQNKRFGEDQCASLGNGEGDDAAAAAVAAADGGEDKLSDKTQTATDTATDSPNSLKALEDTF